MPALLLALLGFAAAPEAQPIRVAVKVAVDHELPSTTRSVLEAEVGALFRPLPLRFDWRGDAEAEVHLTIAGRPDKPVIRGCSRGLHDHRLAIAHLGPVAGTGHVVLWIGQVTQAASGNWDRPAPPLPEATLGRALGRALAHELGHILLGQRGHQARGIMQASLSRGDLVGSRRGFSDEQRKRLSRLWR